MIVLVVDDDVSIRMLLRFFLEDERWSVLEASNGVDALDLIRSEPAVGLLITDVAMPGMNGWELAHEARRERPGLPIVFVSGLFEGAIAPEFRGDAFLEKPFMKTELKDLVESLTGL